MKNKNFFGCKSLVDMTVIYALIVDKLEISPIREKTLDFLFFFFCKISENFVNNAILF